MFYPAGTLVLVDAPNGECIEGTLAADYEDIFEERFTVIVDGEPVDVLQPWNCDIELL